MSKIGLMKAPVAKVAKGLAANSGMMTRTMIAFAQQTSGGARRALVGAGRLWGPAGSTNAWAAGSMKQGRIAGGARAMSSLPSHTELCMPALSPTMTAGNIATFKVKVGDKVMPGDLICDIETDKATIGWESQEEGYVAKILMQDGAQEVPVGKAVLVICDSAADVAAFASYTASGGAPAARAAAPAAAAPAAAPAAAAKSNYPSHTALAMPALSPTMTAGNIATMKVKVGDKLAPGDLICDIETDKATIGWESQEDGYVAAILVKDGQTEVKVGDTCLVIVDSESDIPAFKSYTAAPSGSAPAPAAAAPAAAPAPAKPASAPAPGAPGGAAPIASNPRSSARVYATPLARTLARESKVDLAAVRATGPHGRVIGKDVIEALESGTAMAGAPAAAGVATSAAPPGVAGTDYTEIPHTNVRKVIASRLLQSKTTVPHYYLTVELTIDHLLALREKLNSGAKKDKEGKPEFKLSVNDFIIKACALSLKENPEVNSSWMETFIRRYNYVDISVAVSSPTGLITPIVADADLKGLVAISKEVKLLAEKARNGKLQPHEFQGGTFSISNLGMFGVTGFSAIINPPQSCILAVGETQDKVVVKKDGSFGVSKVMRVTLSCDHRTVDGAVGATYLQSLRKYIEDPTSMLL